MFIVCDYCLCVVASTVYYCVWLLAVCSSCLPRLLPISQQIRFKECSDRTQSVKEQHNHNVVADTTVVLRSLWSWWFVVCCCLLFVVVFCCSLLFAVVGCCLCVGYLRCHRWLFCALMDLWQFIDVLACWCYWFLWLLLLLLLSSLLLFLLLLLLTVLCVMVTDGCWRCLGVRVFAVYSYHSSLSLVSISVSLLMLPWLFL